MRKESKKELASKPVNAEDPRKGERNYTVCVILRQNFKESELVLTECIVLFKE